MNHRPRAYESPALPLSYSAAVIKLTEPPPGRQPGPRVHQAATRTGEPPPRPANARRTSDESGARWRTTNSICRMQPSRQTPDARKASCAPGARRSVPMRSRQSVDPNSATKSSSNAWTMDARRRLGEPMVSEAPFRELADGETRAGQRPARPAAVGEPAVQRDRRRRIGGLGQAETVLERHERGLGAAVAVRGLEKARAGPSNGRVRTPPVVVIHRHRSVTRFTRWTRDRGRSPTAILAPTSVSITC